MLNLTRNTQEENEKMLSALHEYRKVLGITTIVTDDRIPKTGLSTIDKKQFELWGREYTADSIIDALFFSRFVTMAAIPPSDEGE